MNYRFLRLPFFSFVLFSDKKTENAEREDEEGNQRQVFSGCYSKFINSAITERLHLLCQI
jgi:hypothetical protein